MGRSLRILYVTNRVPGNMNRGDTQRATILYRALAAAGHVETVLLADPAIFHPDRSPTLRNDFGVIDCHRLPQPGEYGPWRWFRSLRPGLIDRLAHNLGDPAVTYNLHAELADILHRHIQQGGYDLVVSRYLQPTAAAGLLDHRPLLLDLDDIDMVSVHSRMHRPEVGRLQQYFLQRKFDAIQRTVPPLLGRWSLGWVCCPEDEQIIQSACMSEGRPVPRLSLLPNIPNVSSTTPFVPPPGDKVVISVGTLWFRPNYEGVDWFVRSVWPAIRRAHPLANYRIIGRGAPERLGAAWAAVPGVTVVGFAEDLQSEYARCDLAVAPVFDGAGTKIKVLEALAFGRVCAVSTHAHRGYESTFRDGQEVIVSDDPAIMATACADILSNPAQSAQRGESARRKIEREFSFSRFSQIVRASIQAVLASSPTRLRPAA